MNDKAKEELKRFFKGIMSDAVIVAMSLIYTLTAFLTLGTTGKSLWQIISEGVLVFLMGFLMNREFEHQGLEEGDRTDTLTGAMSRHADMVEKVVPYIDDLEDWCDKKNVQALKHARERILAEGCLKYSDYFDEDGKSYEFIPDENKLKNRHIRKLEIARIKTYYKAISIRLTPLRADVLISEGGRDGDPFWLGRSKPEYARESSRKDAITKIILAIVFGCYCVTLVTDFNVANLIWKLFQVIVFLCIGSTKKKQAYNYMTGEYHGRITKKTVHLTAFVKNMGIEKPENEIMKEKTEYGEQQPDDLNQVG